MRIAISEAMKSVDEVPVGAAIFDLEGNLVSVAHNNREFSHDPTGHAEIIALRGASLALGSWRLEGASVVVTMEPCPMCAAALRVARVSSVIFGAESASGAGGSLYDILRDERLGRVPEVVSGVLSDECQDLTTNFFRRLRGSGESVD